MPFDAPDVLCLRPLNGRDDDITGLFVPLESRDVAVSQFPLPDPANAGDLVGARVLYDALRLSVRAGASPFRCAGRLGFGPRTYQYVPLVMALRQERVRLLIADDVGTGKTIEALLIAREMLDRGLIRRIGVLCPAHLCDQWETELREKFAVDARVLQPSRIARLEREVPRQDVNVLAYFPHLVASIDFMKSDRRRDAYLRNPPDLLIVDEAHGSARPRGQRESAQHQRYEFVRELAARVPHLLLTTATPHSGIEENFRSLLGLLDPKFDLPEELDLDRSLLQPHVVQRRRRDIESWHGEETRFPERIAEWATYDLSAGQQRFFERLLAYCRETVRGRPELAAPQQRVRHWAALALLRCALSSPGAATTMLSGRSEGFGAMPHETAELDDAYRAQVLDPSEDEAVADHAPSAPLAASQADLSDGERRRLVELSRLAAGLVGPEHDRKLGALVRIVEELVREGAQPIVFCRYIATANYLAEWLQRLLGERFPELRVVAVTGALGEEVRRKKVEELAQATSRVLVATDCLSEGINLQEHFGAVVHYDLPWNPNRLDQREGRVDRFGQVRPKVRAIVLYGANNPVDLVVLDVLLRKARQIRQTLGFALPIPVEAEGVLEAVLESVLLQGGTGVQLQLGLMPPEVGRFHGQLDERVRSEERQRAYFSQPSIDATALAEDIGATTALLGDQATLRRFLADAAQRFGGELRPRPRDAFSLVPGALAARVNATGLTTDKLRFDHAEDGAILVTRTSPLIEAYCDAVIGGALAGDRAASLPRCGATFTDAVSRRTAVLLLRLRYELVEEGHAQFAEEVVVEAFTVENDRLVWQDETSREFLERVRPAANMTAGERTRHVSWALALLQNGDSATAVVTRRATALIEAHQKARRLERRAALEVRPHIPPDVVGCFVLVPAGRE
jgi:superfamily II DNA or RNA helicase